MNKISILTILLLTIAIQSFAQKSTAVILDVRTGILPDDEPATHKHHDAIVYRTTLEGKNKYVLVYYQNENNVVHAHKALLTSNEDYKRADLEWIDNKIAVRLYNAATNKETKFKASGDGKSNNMEVD